MIFVMLAVFVSCELYRYYPQEIQDHFLSEVNVTASVLVIHLLFRVEAPGENIRQGNRIVNSGLVSFL